MLPGIRKRLGFTSRRELAYALGVSEQTVASWESGRRPVPNWLPLAIGFIRSFEAILENVADCVVSEVDMETALSDTLSSGLELIKIYDILELNSREEMISKEDINKLQCRMEDIDKLIIQMISKIHYVMYQKLYNSKPELFYGLSKDNMYEVQDTAVGKFAALLAQRVKEKIETQKGMGIK